MCSRGLSEVVRIQGPVVGFQGLELFAVCGASCFRMCCLTFPLWFLTMPFADSLTTCSLPEPVEVCMLWLLLASVSCWAVLRSWIFTSPSCPCGCGMAGAGVVGVVRGGIHEHCS